MVKYTLEEIRKSADFSGAEKDLMASFEPGQYTLAEIREKLAREKERKVK